MKKPEKTTILLSLFTILTLISIITVYTTHQTPTEETTTNTLCTYTSTATYDYTALLEPNTIYNNKTTLKPNEGTLYTKITKQINITLTYTFHATLPTETTITYSLTQTLKTGALQYQIATTPLTTTNQTQINITIPPVNKNALQAIKSTIESETGTSASTYFVQTTPTFTINANTTAGTIYQVFTPALAIEFTRTDQGEVITIEDLHQTKSDAITENQTTTRSDIINQRYASYILTTISIAGLFFSTYFYTKTKPKTKEKPLEKLIAPYKDLIIEATEPPKTTPETTTINITTIQELAKTAEILAKPIILTRKPTPTLTIIDQNTTYQHKP
jgi:hypothetical protein